MELILIFIKLLLALGGFGWYIFCCYCRFDNCKALYKKRFFGLVSIALAILFSCIALVPSNTVGVLYSPINGTSEATLQEGIHFKLPFDTVYKIDTTVQERTSDDVSVQTKDAQYVKMSINIKYQVSSDNAFIVYKGYKTLDKLNENIIINYAQTALNEVSTQYNVIDLLGEKRNEIISQTMSLLADKYAVEGVTLKEITVKDIDAGEQIEKAISEEAVAKKAVETAKQLQEKSKTEAETKLIEAEGEAKANAVKTKQLTNEILLEQWIEKWNGILPAVSGSDSNIIDISELLKEKTK